ncbi:MAG: porphobilinogen synthase [Clostridiales bacterium]|nr:porphobilinogen synthase [Clostridiales bacterium]
MQRMRRLRTSPNIRAFVRETKIDLRDLVYPVFVIEGENIKNAVESMPGIYQYSVDRLDEELERVSRKGIKAILIFGIPGYKDEKASEAYNKDGVTQRAVRHIKEKYPDLIVIADVCLCEYTSHGHCGLVRNGNILNDETLKLLCKMSISLVEAGADIIAPSDMMDGRVGAIRQALDEKDFINTPIMAYSAKYASAYYGPFREAADSAPKFGDRKSYQMDSANAKMAMREIQYDIDEGADIVMVKPALAYLDVIKEASVRFDHTIAAYNVSGEYSMVKAAANMGWIDEKKIVLENITAIKRAGAKIIITYHALDIADWLSEKEQE